MHVRFSDVLLTWRNALDEINMPLLRRVTQSFVSEEGLYSRLQNDRNHLLYFVVLLNGEVSWCGKQKKIS